MTTQLAAVALAAIALTACSDDEPAPTTSDAQADAATEAAVASDAFPDVIDAQPSFSDATSSWSFAVTISSPYDTPERYADGWRVVGPDGVVYGVHTLLHDHANEQPFTRTQTGVEIPDDVQRVTVEGRDLANGFGGGTFEVDLGTER